MRNTNGGRGVVWLLACAALLTVAAATLCHLRLSMETARTDTSRYRFTETAILSRSEPLVQALLTGATKIDTVACPTTTFTSAGQSVHHWNIDCIDPNSGDVAHLLWNADTGELMRASHFQRHTRLAAFNAVSAQKDGVALAWDWFHALKIDRPSEEWRVVGAHYKHYAEWDIYLRAEDHYSILTVKTDTGQLVQALCGHLPDAHMAWAPFKTGLAS